MPGYECKSPSGAEEIPNYVAAQILNSMKDDLRTALALGDPQKVLALINTGADIHYQADHGYDAFIDAVHGRDVLHDPHLIELLELLLDNGVSVTGMSTYGESAVRVLSRIGRFDAVRLLLDAGANSGDVRFTELIEAVVFGSLADVNDVIGSGADLEERDFWERTPWLVAVQTGDIPKAQSLLERGAQRDARGRCGKPPLFYAIENGHIPMLEWLLEIGVDLCQTDEFEGTALAEAAGYKNAEAVEVLLRAGADVNQRSSTVSALWNADTRAVAMKLLGAGADPQELTSQGRRVILAYPPEPDADLLRVTVDDFRRNRLSRFGTRNPELMNNPFWEGMIRSGLNAYQAEVLVEGDRDYMARPGPIWCADRFGQSLTFLPDGRIVQIAGEHEDGSDPDFCIYNDVFVHATDGAITIYGYPASLFPPTDFHTATLVDDYIYLIGSLGYQGSRQFGRTPVYRLDVETFQMERLETTGEQPGWIYKHRAVLSDVHEITISGGTVLTNMNGREVSSENPTVSTLNVKTLVWTNPRKAKRGIGPTTSV